MWNLDSKDFNEWRKENDLPQLFDFFQRRLPEFNIWMSTYFSGIKYLINIEYTGKLISGAKKMTIIRYIQENGDDLTMVLISNSNLLKNIKKRLVQIIEERHYIPYIQWARKRNKSEIFILSDLNLGVINSIPFLVFDKYEKTLFLHIEYFAIDSPLSTSYDRAIKVHM